MKTTLAKHALASTTLLLAAAAVTAITPQNMKASPSFDTMSEDYQLILQRQLRNSSIIYQRYEVAAKKQGTLSVAHVVKVPLNPSEIDVILSRSEQRGYRPSVYAQAASSLVTINGSFFDANFKALGLSISEGRAYSGTNDSESFQVFGCSAFLFCYVETSRGKVQDDSSAPAFQTALSGKPTLVRGRTPRTVQDDNACGNFCQTRNPRTAVGLDSSGTLLSIVLVEGRHPGARGATLAELGRFMAARGVDAAINLDGGGSSSLVIEGRVVSQRPTEEPNERPVANALSIVLQK